ncbi:MAG TPA: tetratricopeptide repeat protein [Caulifigura sp.]|nr:tetratricopeptide repeat protein [Caulifigura sp.]
MPAVSEVGALCDQARVLMKQKKISEARALFEQAVQRDPRSIPAFEGAAATAFAEKDLPRAAELYKKLTLLDLRRSQPAVNLGAVYNRMGDYAAAIKTLRSAVAKDKKCAAAYYNMGIAHKGLNQLSMAVTAYKEAVRLDPKMVDASYNLGNLLLEMGSFQQAVLYFEKAVEAQPDFEKAQRGLQRAYDAKDESKKNQKAFGRLVDEETTAKNQQEVEFRLLTPKERFEDRQALHQLAKETENLAIAVLAQVRDELAPALQRLQHSTSAGADVRMIRADATDLRETVGRFHGIAASLQEKLESVRAHEHLMRD